MLNVNMTDFAEACLRADVSSNETQIFVDRTVGFPSANANTNDCFYIKITRSSDGAWETMRVTLTIGQAWTIERAAGLSEIALDFCAGDTVQSGVFAPAVLNINTYTRRTTDVGSLPTTGVLEGSRAMDTTNDTWVEYEFMNGSWNVTGRTFDSLTNTFA